MSIAFPNDFFATQPIKCPFFVPKERVQLIEARATMKRFLEVVNLTPEEIPAAQNDLDKLDDTLERTKDEPLVLATWDIRSNKGALTVSFTHVFSSLST